MPTAFHILKEKVTERISLLGKMNIKSAVCFYTIKHSVLLPVNQLTACQPPNLQREKVGTITIWPQTRMCFMRVERGKRGRRGLTVGLCGGECDGVFHQQLSMSAHPHILGG